MSSSGNSNQNLSLNAGKNPVSKKEMFELLNNLSFIEKEITSLNGSSEKEFLNIGGKLQSYLSTSRELLEVSQQAGDSISNEILSGGINKLNGLLEEFSNNFSSSAKEIKTKKEYLQNIFVQMEDIIEALLGFNKIVKRLKMLGISTKIESSRLGTNDNGFNLLAERVEKLSGTINDKAESILRKAGSLKNELNKTITELENLEREQNKQSRLVLENTSHSLQIFQNKFSDCMAKIDNNIFSYTNINNNISRIVTDIQFHDITRQQFEHVKDSLCVLKSELEKTDFQNAVEDAAATIRTSGDICELQKIQLSNSLNEYENAVGNIIKNLVNVESSINEIISNSNDMLSDAGFSENNILKNVQIELDVIASGLDKNNNIEIASLKSIKSVVEIVGELASQVEEIEDIGSELEIIALNARVKAARTGINGMALGVIAESIQNLSLDAKLQTVSTIKVFKSIEKYSQKLNENNVEYLENEKTGSIQFVKKEINELINSILSHESGAASLIVKLQSGVNSLNKDLNSTIKKMSHGNDVKSSVNKIIKILNSIVDFAAIYGGGVSGKEKKINSLLKNYTMNSEREIHNNFMKKNSSPKAKDENKNDTENSFGGNIELF